MALLPLRRNDYEKIIDYCQIDIFAVMTAIGIKICKESPADIFLIP